MRKSIKYSFIGLLALGFVALASVVHAYPAVGVAIWPSVYGMEYAGSHIIVDKAMPAQTRADLLRDAEAATAVVRTFYGAFHRQPILVACSTEACARKLKEQDTMGLAIPTPFRPIVSLSPNGLNLTILTHEFAHTELDYRVGLWVRATGTFPVWFDEGVAVLVSEDSRYLNPGTTASQRCLRYSERPLPTSPFDWSSKATKDEMLYPDAVCRVLQWMEANGGKAGLLNTIDAVANGVAFSPENGRRN